MNNIIDRLSLYYPYTVSAAYLIFRIILYFVLLVTLVLLVAKFNITSHIEEKINGMKNPLIKYYNASFTGILFMTINTFITSSTLFLTHGKVMFLGNKNALFYTSGTLILLYGLVNIAKSIISFSRAERVLLNLFFNLAMITGIIGEIAVINGILELIPSLQSIQVESIMIIGGLLYFIMIIGLAIAFIQQLKNKPSTLEKLRLQFIFFVFTVQLIQLISRVFILASGNNPVIYNSLIFLVSPLIDFFGYIFTIIFLMWSIFTPIWLQVKVNVIPKEFMHIL